MARDLTADMQAAATEQVVAPVLLYEGEFPSGTTRMWTGIGTLEWNGHTWLGAGNFLGISPVEETTEFKATGVEVQLSGVPQSLLSLALQEMRLGNKGKVYLGLIGHAVKHSGTAQGGDVDELTLAADASDVDGAYNGKWLRLADGRMRRIISYDGATKVAKVEKRWPTNLFQSSDNPSNAYWGKQNTTISADVIPARDGTPTADKVVENSANDFHSINRNLGTIVADAWYSLSVEAKAGERTNLCINNSGVAGVWQGLSSGNQPSVVFRLTDGAIVSQNVGLQNVQILDLGNGWWRCAMLCQAGSSPPGGSSMRLFLNNASSYQGDAASGLYVRRMRWEFATDFGDPNEDIETVLAVDLPDSSTDYEVLEYGVIDDPLLLFEGQTDVPTIQEGGEDATIAVAYESRLIAMMQPHEVRYTDEEQRRRYPDDTGFAWVASLQDKEIVW